MKTAALFRFAALAGAVLGRANPEARALLAAFGQAFGVAFQLADDLEDKDAAADPAALRRQIEEAETFLPAFGRDGETLRTLVRSLAR
jgi:farnesyl diphosphate synthase